jgi:DnaJ-class molecular chaperone
MEFKDYYTTLGIAKTASDAEIKRAYRKLARQFHPDLNPGDKAAETRFKEINEANEVLGDQEKRRKYDELGANWRAYENAPPGPGAGGGPGGSWSPSSGGASYRTMSPEDVQDLFGGADPFSDFFHTFFTGDAAPQGGARGRPSRGGARSRRGRDIEQAIDLTLEEALAGATRRLVSSRHGEERSVEVRIPAGAREGTRVRASGEGEGGHGGGAAGDLYLVVHILPHARFHADGADLRTRIDIPATTGVLGGEVSVPTLSGQSVRLKVPPLTDHGRVFRLRGHGMPVAAGSTDRGDLYATVDIRIPKHVSDEAKQHYEALKALEYSDV